MAEKLKAGLAEGIKARMEKGLREKKSQGDIQRLLNQGVTLERVAKAVGLDVSTVERHALTYIQDLHRLNKAFRAQTRLDELEAEKLREDIQGLETLEGVIRAACVAIRPMPMVYHPVSSLKKTRSTAVLGCGDWHIGKVVTPKEIENIGVFNWSVSRARVKFLGERFLHNIETLRAGFTIDDLVLFCVGDFISGMIHKELEMFNEFSPPVQAVKAGELLGSLVTYLAPHFGTVRIEAQAADNHGRLYAKPMAKGKAEHNFNAVVYAVMQAMTAKFPNVVYNIMDGMKGVSEVENTRFLIEHGDTIKGWMGIPFYGIEREKNREKIKRMVLERVREIREKIGFDILFHGHFHSFNLQEEIIGNGSLSGTDEYDHSCGRYALPHQVSFLVHPKFGVHSFNRWMLP